MPSFISDIKSTLQPFNNLRSEKEIYSKFDDLIKEYNINSSRKVENKDKNNISKSHETIKEIDSSKFLGVENRGEGGNSNITNKTQDLRENTLSFYLTTISETCIF